MASCERIAGSTNWKLNSASSSETHRTEHEFSGSCKKCWWSFQVAQSQIAQLGSGRILCQRLCKSEKCPKTSPGSLRLSLGLSHCARKTQVAMPSLVSQGAQCDQRVSVPYFLDSPALAKAKIELEVK